MPLLFETLHGKTPFFADGLSLQLSLPSISIRPCLALHAESVLF